MCAYLITGFSNLEEVRQYVKDIIRFIPSHGISVWLVDPPGIYISGDTIDENDIAGLHRENIQISPIETGTVPEGTNQLELLYGGVF